MVKSIGASLQYLALLWLAFIFGVSLHLNHYGIMPRETRGLLGIVAAPFLHGNVQHLIHNSIFLVLFMTMYGLTNSSGVHQKFWFFAIVSGGLTWIFGAPGIHIGASGVIYGFFAYLAMQGFFRGKILDIVLSIAILVLYGSIIFGVLPWNPLVSWEGHLFGLLGGAFLAWWDRPLIRRRN